jgi:hypothetical protein
MEGPAIDGDSPVREPSPAELASKVKQAALDVSPRTVLDPRVGVRYLATLTSRLVKLQGGLLLRAIVDTDAAANNRTGADRSNERSIA